MRRASMRPWRDTTEYGVIILSVVCELYLASMRPWRDTTEYHVRGSLHRLEEREASMRPWRDTTEYEGDGLVVRHLWGGFNEAVA